MAIDPDDGRLRQYLLGVLTDEQCTALEEEYFAREETLDRISTAEEELIDDYLDDRLAPDQRTRFDRHYLASPVHQHRVAVARQLRARQPVPHQVTPPRRTLTSIVRSLFEPPLALKVASAALLVAIAIGGAWLVRSRSARQPIEAPTNAAVPGQPPRADTPTPNVPAPVVLAVALSPTGVRGTDDSPRVTIPPGTDRVAIHLESAGAFRPLTKGRAVVHTVTGREVWRGAATVEALAGAPVLARIEIPADRLAPDDYIITLFETRDRAPEIEGFRYFLRIRAR